MSVRTCKFSWFIIKIFKKHLVFTNLKQYMMMCVIVFLTWLHWHINILYLKIFVLLRKTVSFIHFILIWIIRIFFVFHKSLCSFNTLCFSELMSTSFQINEFDSYCFFQFFFKILFSIFVFSFIKFSLHFFIHFNCCLLLMNFLLMLLCQKWVCIFLQIFFISLFMLMFLCWCLNTVILTFKYRSKSRICIFIFSIIIKMILYISIIICRYLFWILINFLTEFLTYHCHVAVIIFSFLHECHIAASCVIMSLITALYIWYAVARIIFYVEIIMQINALIWIFILFVIFLMCFFHHNLKFILTSSICINSLSVRILFSIWSKTLMLNLQNMHDKWMSLYFFKLNKIS